MKVAVGCILQQSSMRNTDKVAGCLVFNLPLLELHQVIAGAQQVDGIYVEFPAVWLHCFLQAASE